MKDPTRDVRALPVLGEDASCRGHVRIDVDRLRGQPVFTGLCITIDTTSYLSPWEARAFAAQLIKAADKADGLHPRCKCGHRLEDHRNRYSGTEQPTHCRVEVDRYGICGCSRYEANP